MAPHSQGPPAILVVEDVPLLRRLIADCLIDAGFEVAEAADAQEALGVLDSRSDIRLVFTDLVMPGGFTGRDLVRKVHERWPHIAILLTSGQETPTAAELRDEAGFLAKPYRPSVLVRMVRALLQEH